jgi:segregation and condensation protein B
MTDDITPAHAENAADAVSGTAVDVARAIEAILMVADDPQSIVSLGTALGVPVKQIKTAVAELVADYDGANGGVQRGFELREVAGGWRIYVRAEFDHVVTDFVLTQNPTRLSPAALETLAVIAYKQPISRGQNVDGVVRTLVSRGLITEVSTDVETGAVLYGTTDLLLTQLGINSLEEMPAIAPLLSDGQEGFDADA